MKTIKVILTTGKIVDMKYNTKVIKDMNKHFSNKI